jgi:transposase
MFYILVMKGFLTKEQRLELLKELMSEDKRKYADRFRVILLLDDGEKYVDIAKFLFLNEGTIKNYRKRYVENGIMGLIVDYHIGSRSKLTHDQEKELTEYLRTNIIMDCKLIIDHIESKYRVVYTVSGVTDLLHRLGFTYKKTKAVPGKANKEKQELFIETYNKLKRKFRLIYFLDSTHPMHNSVLSHGWIMKGEDFNILSNSGRHRLNINGAVNIKTKEVITELCDWVNTESICKFLEKIRKVNGTEEVITLIMDNARYNNSIEVQLMAKTLNFNLVYLPAYSPNLNPIERVWKFFKKKVLYNQYYEKKQDFEFAVKKFFKNIRKYNDELSTLLTDNFQVLGT